MLELILARYFEVNVFRYITFRGAGAALTSFVFALAVGPSWIRLLRRGRVGEVIESSPSDKVREMHAHKEGTPTMGGFLILVGTILSTVFWAKVGNLYVAMGLITILLMGGLGFVDDYFKLIRRPGRGLTKREKLIAQILISAGVGVVLMRVMGSLQVNYLPGTGTDLFFPFFKNVFVPLGILFIPLVVLVMVGTSNAVNLTDGLDGLAAGCAVMATLAFVAISYVVGHAVLSRYLFVFYVPGAGELAILCAALAGGTLAFLWYNCYPAQIFMGDTGALAIGGVLGYVAVVTRQEIMLFFIGGVFVAEALSVIIQTYYFKLTGGKRFFRCAPLHHHFELKGIHEVKVVVRFSIVAALCAIFSLAMLKLR